MRLQRIVADKAPPARPLPVVPARSLDRFLANGHSVLLTDDHGPGDQLLPPVFSQALRDR